MEGGDFVTAWQAYAVISPAPALESSYGMGRKFGAAAVSHIAAVLAPVLLGRSERQVCAHSVC